MTKPCLVPELSRALPPAQYAVIAALRKLTHGGVLAIRQDGGIATPEISAARDLQELARAQTAPALPRLGRCDWLDAAGHAPVNESLAAARQWLDRVMEGVNAGLAAGAPETR